MGYVEDIKKESRKKGVYAAAGAAGTVTLAVAGAPILAAGAAVGTVYLTYKWFKHRAKAGLRF